MKQLFASWIVLLTCACNDTAYLLSDTSPAFQVIALQHTYVVEQTAYFQLKVSESVHWGTLQLCPLISQGNCKLEMNAQAVPTDGSWSTLCSPTEILALTPQQSGTLEVTLEIRSTKGGEQSNRSTLHLEVMENTALDIAAECESPASISQPIEIELSVNKSLSLLQLPITLAQLAGVGKLQFGALNIPDGGSFLCPVNTPQILYYTAEERGIHRLQFSVSDGYNTQFCVLEIIVTK